MTSADVPAPVAIPRSALSAALVVAAGQGDHATCAALSRILGAATGGTLRIEVMPDLPKPAGRGASPGVAAPADPTRDPWEEWVSLRHALAALTRGEGRAHQGAARRDDRVEAALVDIEAFVRGLIDIGPLCAVPACAGGDGAPDRAMPAPCATVDPAAVLARLRRFVGMHAPGTVNHCPDACPMGAVPSAGLAGPDDLTLGDLRALAGMAPPDAPSPDRMAVLRCTVTLPTPAMVRTRLERDGWAREPSAVDGVALYTLVPPGFETEFELAMPDEATTSNGWKSHVEQALRTLAGLEDRADEDARNRPIGDLAAEIVAEAAVDPVRGR